LILLSPRPSTSFLMKLCASFPSKSKLRPDKEPDSRLLSLSVIDKDTLVLESRLLRKFKLPSKVLFSMLRTTSFQSEEVTGVPESVVFIPSHAR